MSSLRDKIKAADDIKRELVEVPEWGVTVEVRTISGAARAQLFAEATDKNGKLHYDDAYTGLIIASVFDPETGERVFSAADADWLKKKSSNATERLTEVAVRLSGLSPEAIGQAEKNSDSDTLNDDSTTT